MKQAEIVRILAQDFETSVVAELNKLLTAKSAPVIRYKIMGKKWGHLGFTGPVKMVTDEGLKVIDVNKVVLVRYAEIEGFEKAKPKVPRVYPPRKAEDVAVKKAKAKTKKVRKDDDEGYDDEPEERIEKFRKASPGKGGSSFIPSQRKPKKG